MSAIHIMFHLPPEKELIQGTVVFSLQSDHTKIHLEVETISHKWSWAISDSVYTSPKNHTMGINTAGFDSNKLNTVYVKGNCLPFQAIIRSFT